MLNASSADATSSHPAGRSYMYTEALIKFLFAFWLSWQASFGQAKRAEPLKRRKELDLVLEQELRMELKMEMEIEIEMELGWPNEIAIGSEVQLPQ
uniref:HDC11811 n=1 Tax=Drosophila melanogaster TaxID=7227 RepID=Q6IKR2_DROME|nr:TPA_inf: HDC11811 [Drosophila melanogaster]